MGEWPEGPRGRGRTLLGLTVVMFLFLMSTPASALICAPSDMTPEQLVAANLESSRKAYDLAVVGRVVAITTDLSEGDGYGRTYVQLSLIGVFGLPKVEGRGFVVTTLDPGWASGYAFEEGADYFVPLVLSGGETNPVEACDHVQRLSDAGAAAQQLAEVADANGLEYTFPIEDRAGGTLATIIFVVLMGGLLFWTGKKRRASRSQLGDTDFGPRRRA